MKNKTFKINQRRYLGNKNKILYFIDEIIKNEIGNFTSLCDIFAGTGVVGQYFNNHNTKIISNEMLYSNYICLYAFLADENYNLSKIQRIIHDLNNIKSNRGNYVSKHFGNKYFSIKNAKKIGNIREEIEKIDLSFKEKSIILTSLLYAIDKVANTVGHYDAYREKMDTLNDIELLIPYIEPKNNFKNEVYNEDANYFAERLNCDILYIDPPYNSRQYCDTYHVLENIIKWEKPDVFGKAAKFDRKKLKSKYNLKEASETFEDLIKTVNCNYILFSYNNMSNKGNGRSNAKITDDEIIRILSNKGKLKIFETSHKAFSSGKSNIEDNKERIFFCGGKMING